MRLNYLITTEHLEDRLWFLEDEDFVVGMNHVAMQAVLKPEVRILSFILMSNHVHFVLKGTKTEVQDFVNDFKRRYSMYLFQKYGVRGHLRENDLDIREIPLQETEALERAIAYVQMNCVAAGVCAHPSQYPWGTGNSFFQTVGQNSGQGSATRLGKRLATLSFRARQRLMHSTLVNKLPLDWLVSEAGYLLPESYTAVKEVEQLFRSPTRMNYFLNSSSKARKRLEIEEERIPAFKDQLIRQALPDLYQGLFRKDRFEDLSPEDQVEVLRQIRFRFSANIHQAARVCGLTYAEAARLIDSV